MKECPADITRFLKTFCKTCLDEPSQSPARLFSLDNERSGNPKPQDFLHLFLHKSEYLVDFLESLVNERTGWDSKIYNTLVEHYLVNFFPENKISLKQHGPFQVLWKKNAEGCAPSIEVKLMNFLQNPDTNYDRDHVFLLCQMYGFAPGRIFLYEENKM